MRTMLAMTATVSMIFGMTTAGVAQADSGACGATAKAARQACKNEIGDDFWIAIGNCANLPAKNVTKACGKAARQALAEAKTECSDQFDARQTLCDALGAAPYDPPIDAASFRSPASTAANPNPYFPLMPGTVWVYQGGGETITVTVTDRTKLIAGVTTIVVTDLVTVAGVVEEDTEDYFAQQLDGTVWYFGELSRQFENGDLVGVEGSFQAGRDDAKPGIIMKAVPMVGDIYRQEFALGDAEDGGEVISTTGSETTPGGNCSGTCVVTRDFSPISPGADEHKFYAPGIGIILEVDVDTGLRTELISVTHN